MSEKLNNLPKLVTDTKLEFDFKDRDFSNILATHEISPVRIFLGLSFLHANKDLRLHQVFNILTCLSNPRKGCPNPIPISHRPSFL